MISHELRTPLQAIGAAADMLERFGDQMNESERREETLTIRRAVSTLARLVDGVLVLGTAEAAAGGDGDDAVDLARLCRPVWRGEVGRTECRDEGGQAVWILVVD